MRSGAWTWVNAETNSVFPYRAGNIGLYPDRAGNIGLHRDQAGNIGSHADQGGNLGLHPDLAADREIRKQMEICDTYI